MSVRLRLFIGGLGLAISLSKYLLQPPQPYKNDRLCKIPEDAVKLDNQLYDSESFIAEDWHHPHQPLLAYNSARAPFFAGHLSKHLKGGDSVLDVGCGAGLLTEDLAKRLPHLRFEGVDLSPQSAKLGNKHAKESGVDNVHYQQGSAYSLPFPDNSFDAVVSSDVIEHMYDLRKYSSEIKRVLKPGRVFIFDTINRTLQSNLISYWLGQRIFRFLPQDVHHPQLFVTPSELRTLLEEDHFDLADDSEIVGMRPTLEIERFWETVKTEGYLSPFRNQHVRWSLLGEWVQTSDISQSYGWYAIRRK